MPVAPRTMTFGVSFTVRSAGPRGSTNRATQPRESGLGRLLSSAVEEGADASKAGAEVSPDGSFSFFWPFLPDRRERRGLDSSEEGLIRLMTWELLLSSSEEVRSKSSLKCQDFRLHWCWIRHHPVHDHAGGGDASCVRQSQNLSHRNRIVDRPLPKCPQKNHRQRRPAEKNAASVSGSSISLTFTT